MTQTPPRWLTDRRGCRVSAILAGVVLLARLLASINTFSPTTDEPCHIGAAVSMVEAHELVALVDHPPLARWVAAVPLWLDGARLPQCRGMHTVEKNDVGYALGTQVLYHSAASYRRLLRDARCAMLVFPLAALLFLYRTAAWLADETVAAASVFFFSVDPTLLGHGFWVCTDVPACAGFLAAWYYGLRWIDRPGLGRAMLAGAAYGAAAGLKFSCVFLLPGLLLLVIVRYRTLLTARWRHTLLEWAAAAVGAFVTLWAIYCFNVGPLGDQNVLGHPPAWERLPHALLWTPVPMPSFFLGFARLMAHNAIGQSAYLNGNVRATGWWYYFPEMLLVKSPLGWLIALGAAAVLALIRGDWRRWAVVASLIPAGVFLLVSMAGHIDVGIRHILPAIALLYFFTAWQLLQTRGSTWLLLGCCCVAAVETAAVHPDYMAFFNVAAGGISHGDRLALDSNLDWNQDLYRLADYLHANPPRAGYALRLTGQRNGDLLRQLGLDPAALHRSPHGTRLLISKNARLLVNELPWLSRYSPMAHVGVSIDVYDLPPARPDEPDDAPGPDDPGAR